MKIELTNGDRLSLIAALQAFESGKNIHEMEMILDQGGSLWVHRTHTPPYRNRVNIIDDDKYTLSLERP